MLQYVTAETRRRGEWRERLESAVRPSAHAHLPTPVCPRPSAHAQSPSRPLTLTWPTINRRLQMELRRRAWVRACAVRAAVRSIRRCSGAAGAGEWAGGGGGGGGGGRRARPTVNERSAGSGGATLCRRVHGHSSVPLMRWRMALQPQLRAGRVGSGCRSRSALPRPPSASPSHAQRARLRVGVN
jgi:hypothetical protein